MALEVVTDGKNDKTKKNDQEYVHNKRTRDATCVLFCVPPSFVLIDNKYTPVERKQRRTENETVVFVSSQIFFRFLFCFVFQDYAIKADII